MKNAFTFCAKAVLAALALAGCSVGSTGGGYNESVNSASYSVNDISYTGDAKAGDALSLSKIQITLTCVDADNSSQIYCYNPKETYDHLKQKSASFSLTITADGEQVISFGDDENFPETGNPFIFDAGAVEISIRGAIGGNEVSNSCDISVEGNSQGDGNENPPTTNPEEPEKPNERAENYEELLKMILGEDEYEKIKANLANLNLTADLIKEVGDKWDAIMTTDEHDGTVREYAEGFVAQAKKYIKVTTELGMYSLASYTNPITFSGDFNLSEISFPTNNGKGDFSNATLTNNGEDITIDKLNEIRGNYLPKLSFNKEKNISSKSATEIYKLYKSYSSDLSKLDISGNLYRVAMDGREISGNKDYTLFTDDGDKAKLSTDTTITSLTADALVQMYKQLTIYQIWNIIISGDATKEDTVNWELRNVVFEGDMHKITNNFRDPGPNGGNAMSMYGIVYFKQEPYNNIMANALYILNDIE